MTQKEFLTRLAELNAQNVQISAKKNADYADADDPFKNFRACEAYGIPLETGILIRMSDKMMRLANLLNRPPQVKDESFEDTCSDLSNYANILRIIREQKNK